MIIRTYSLPLASPCMPDTPRYRLWAAARTLAPLLVTAPLNSNIQQAVILYHTPAHRSSLPIKKHIVTLVKLLKQLPSLRKLRFTAMLWIPQINDKCDMSKFTEECHSGDVAVFVGSQDGGTWRNVRGCNLRRQLFSGGALTAVMGTVLNRVTHNFIWSIRFHIQLFPSPVPLKRQTLPFRVQLCYYDNDMLFCYDDDNNVQWSSCVGEYHTKWMKMGSK